jgi:hypothetical protein
MMIVSFSAEIIKNDGQAKICTVLLYGVALIGDKEVGRFFLDKREFNQKEYEYFLNGEKQALEESYQREWEEQTIKPMQEIIDSLVKSSNRDE